MAQEKPAEHSIDPRGSEGTARQVADSGMKEDTGPANPHEEHVPALKPGALLANRFRVIRFIAHGGMGELYEAEDLELHESLAIKTLRTEIIEQPRAIERFKREVHLARKVTHPNVCRVYDLFRDCPEGKKEIVFVSMEYLRGETLADHMKRVGRMSPEASFPFIRQIVSALSAAHEAGIIHRDLKPGNVVLVQDSAGGRAVVTDFGLAYRIPGAEGKHSVPGTTLDLSSTLGTTYGTLAYMAPEQLEGRPATVASDIYALGLVIYEMVTGARPFVADTPMGAAVKRLVESPAAPKILNPSLNPAWERAILRCLERDPERRFKSAQDVINALEGNASPSAWAGRSGGRQTPAASAWPPRGRFIWLTGLAILMIALLAGGLRYFTQRKARFAGPSAAASVAVTLRPAVAVLGFTNLSRKADTEWLSTALAETLNTELALGEKLRTIPGENVARTKQALSLPDADSYGLDTLARLRANLNTDIVVSGSYLDAGGKDGHVRIDLRAQDTRTGNTIATISEVGTEAQVLDLILRTGAEVREKLGGGAPSSAADEAARKSAASSPEVEQLYAEGLKKLWEADLVGARADFEKVVTEDPQFALGHDALAQTWLRFGYQLKANPETEKAFQLSEGLSREQRLSIEGHYRESTHEWSRAIEIYSTLVTFFPDNVDYGLEKAKAEKLSGNLKAAMATIEELRKLPSPARDDPHIDHAESNVAYSMGDYKRALAVAVVAEKKGRADRAPLAIASAEHLKCLSLERLGDLDQAAANCKDAAKLNADVNDRDNEGRALLTLGLILQDKGDFEGSRAAREQALALFREAGDKLSEAYAINSRASDLSMHGDHEGAARDYKDALKLYREIDSKASMLDSMSSLAWQYRSLGQPTEAEEEFRQAVSLSEEIGNRHSEAWAVRGLGQVLLMEGDLAGSEKARNRAVQINQDGGEKDLAYGLFSDLGIFKEEQGKLDEANKNYRESERIANEIGDQDGAAEARANEAELLLSEGRPAESESLVRPSLKHFHEENSKDDEGWASAVLARALLAQGKIDEALGIVNSLALESVGDTESRYEFILASAAVRAASLKPEDQRSARESIHAMLSETTRRHYKLYELESRLTLGEIDRKTAHVEEGRRTLIALEKEARTRGFDLIATKAETAAKP